MAKKNVRLTKKEVLKMFGEVDFYEHFKGTGKTESEIKNLVDGFSEELKANKKGEAVEREIIDRIGDTFGDIFAKDIAVIDKRIVNSEFERAQAIIERDKSEALLELFNLAKSDIQEENRDNVEQNITNLDESSKKSKTAERLAAELEGVVRTNDSRISELEEKLQTLRATARRQDEINFYINEYEAEYLSTLGFFKKIGYPKNPEKKAAMIKAYVEGKIEEERTQVNADGTISISDEVRANTPHVLYEETHKGPQELAFEKSAEEIRREIEGLRADNKTHSENIAVQESDKEAQAAAADECKKFIDAYNAIIEDCNKNIAALGTSSETLRNQVNNVKEYTGTIRNMRLQAAQMYYDNLPEDANPLLILSYKAYIARLKDQEKIAETFKSDANPELQATLARDLSLNTENYIDTALEHYICEGFGSGRYNMDLAKLKSNAKNYFGKYTTDIDKKYSKIVHRYEIADKSFTFFTRQVLQTEYVGKNTTHEFDERLNNEIAQNSQALDQRTVSTRNRLEIISPDYDRVAQFTANPTVKRYMALTMVREQLISKKATEGLTEDEKSYLAVVSRRLESEIETAKRNGALIDIANATQVAVETMVPGYDEVVEYAKLQGKDITDPAQREALIKMQKDFRVKTIMSKVRPQDIVLYANYIGADISTTEKRDAFLEKYSSKMADFFTSGQPIVHPSIAKYEKFLKTEKGITALKNNPQAIVDMYNQFGGSGIVVTLNNGELYISTGKEGPAPVKIGAERLLDSQFMVSVGMVMDLPQSVFDEYKKIDDAIPNIKNTFDERQKYVYGKTNDGKDLGILGQASLYTAMDRELSFEEARDELWEKYMSATALTKKRKEITALGEAGAGRNAKEELIKAYKTEYYKIYQEYHAERIAIAEAAKNDSLANPIDLRTTAEPAKEGRNAIYDQEIESPEKKTLYKGGKVRTKSLIDKVAAIDEARKEFETADEVGIEILNEGVATAVVDMLATLDKLKVTNPEVVDKLNAEIAEALKQTVERPDEYAVHIDENRKLSISIGESTYSINDERKVSIEQREATQTVPENPVV